MYRIEFDVVDVPLPWISVVCEASIRLNQIRAIVVLNRAGFQVSVLTD